MVELKGFWKDFSVGNIEKQPSQMHGRCNYDIMQNFYAKLPSQVLRGRILTWQKINLADGQSLTGRCVSRENYGWRKTRWEKSGVGRDCVVYDC